MDQQAIPDAPAPWHLRGRAYWLIYRFPEPFIREAFGGGVAPRGGLGFVGLVDYEHTDVGPYQELMLIPGKASYPGAVDYSVSHIVVDSAASMVNGRRNWGIPKGLADFDWRRMPDGSEHVVARQDEQVMIDIRLRPRGPTLPFSSRLIPGGLHFSQRDAGQTLRTRFDVRCGLRWAQLLGCETPGKRFPNVSGFRPLAVLHQSRFVIDMAAAQLKAAATGETA